MEGQREFTKDKSKRSAEETSDEDRKRAKTEGESSETASQCEGEIPGAALDKPSTSSERPVWSESEDIQFSTDEDSEDSEGSTSGSSGEEEEIYDLVRYLDIAVEAGDIHEANRLQKEIRSSGHHYVTVDRRTPLHLAAIEGFTAATRWLAAREDVQARNLGGNTALHWAARSGHTQCVEVLINAGAGVHVSNKGGHTALHWAAGNGHTQCVQMLINAGADVDARSEFGDTPLHNVCSRSSVNTAKETALALTAETLLRYGAEIDGLNKKKQTPLQLAVIERNDHLVEYLIGSGADLSLLGTDQETALIRIGRRAKTLLEQTHSTGVHEINTDFVESTDQRERKIAVKMILIGEGEAGKTSLLRTLVKRSASLTEPDERTKGVELTIVKLDISPEIMLSAYDFGGQTCYYALHQLFLTEGTLFTLVVNLETYCLATFSTHVTHFYKAISHRVVKAVIKIICTKTDRCTDAEVKQKRQEIFKEVQKLARGEKRKMEERKKELQEAFELLSREPSHAASSGLHSEQVNYKFQHLPREDLNNKLGEVNFKLQNRPLLPESPDEIISVSSKDNEGFDSIRSALVSDIMRFSPGIFPSMDIPTTWDDIRNTIEIEAARKSIISKVDFSGICRKSRVQSNKEVQMVLWYLRSMGRILKYDDKHNKKLDDSIFINPKETLSVLACLFDHEHFHEKFWIENEYVGDLSHGERDRMKKNLTEHGIVTEKVVKYFLMEKQMESQCQQVLHLLSQFDLCIKMDKAEYDVEYSPDENVYRIPSLIKDLERNEIIKLWPDKPSPSTVEMIMKLELNCDYEPVGFFDKSSARINPHLRKRYDMPRCTVALFGNEIDQRVRIHMSEDDGEWSLWLHVRVNEEKIIIGGNKMKALLTRIIDTALYYPSVLFDWYVVCPTCPASDKPRSMWHLLPIETTVLSSENQYMLEPQQCEECSGKFRIMYGFPLSDETLTTLMKGKFMKLKGAVVEKIGQGWRFLPRLLCASVDEAESLIESAAHRYKSDLKGCIEEILQKCSQEQHGYHGYEAYLRLLHAVHTDARNDIIQDANIVEAEAQNVSTFVNNQQKRDEDEASRKRGALQTVFFEISKFIETTEWKFLGRYLEVAEFDLVVINDIAADDLREKVYRVLMTWKRNKSTSATYDQLISVLSDKPLSRRDLADKVKGICKSYKIDTNQSVQE